MSKTIQSLQLKPNPTTLLPQHMYLQKWSLQNESSMDTLQPSPEVLKLVRHYLHF